MTTLPMFSPEAGLSNQILFDCSAFEGWPEWRSMAWWSVPIAQIRQLQQAWMGAVIDFILSQSEPDVVDSLVLGFAGLATRTLPMAEAVVALQRAREMGVNMVGGPDEVVWLDGSSNLSVPPIDTVPHMPALTKSRHPIAKRIVLTARWNSARKLPRALLRPDVTIMVTNQFLQDEARRSRQVLSYRDAGALVLATRAAAGHPSPTFDVDAMAQRFVAAMLPHCPVNGEWRDRLAKMMQAKVYAVLSTCAADIAAVRQAARLPREIWGGSGNAYALRVVALESLRRGGKVKLFDHGGTTAMVPAVDAFAARELAVCTEYVLPSSGLAQLDEQRESEDRIRPLRTTRVTGGRGQKHLLKLALQKSRAARSRPKVIYVSAVLRGFHRTGVIALADPVYLEWQFRVAEALQAMPLDLICKPHPEGVFRGRKHPLECIAPTAYVPFEETIADADAFVFDRCVSTTFWEAVCTDRPIVYLDMQILKLARQVQPMLDRRCSIVPVHFDEFNRPQFDPTALREAIFGAPGRVYPEEFQELLIGNFR